MNDREKINLQIKAFQDKAFLCPICEENDSLEFINGCNHPVCRICLQNYLLITCYPPRCPLLFMGIPCTCIIQDDQCFELLEKENHGRFNDKRKMNRYLNKKNLYPCYAQNCNFSIRKDDNDQCKCSKCGTINCYACSAIHKPNQTCEMWQTENPEIVKSRDLQKLINEEKIRNGKGMYCTQCKIFIEVDGGCDEIICRFCQTELCFRTKQSRWGPMGYGDISGGCKCMVNGEKCHKDCMNCH